MKNLYKSLAAFQQEVEIIHKDTQGYGYTYADLPAIFTVINPLLKKHGLGFSQLVGNYNIKTVVFHCESGESIESDTTIPNGVELKGMNEFQVLGSAITYVRRYAISAILGLVTDKDTDAGGEQVTTKKKTNANNDFPWLNKNDDNWAKVINAMKSGYTIDQVKSRYKISKQNETELIQLAQS